jgi:hypothetical protein
MTSGHRCWVILGMRSSAASHPPARWSGHWSRTEFAGGSEGESCERSGEGESCERSGEGESCERSGEGERGSTRGIESGFPLVNRGASRATRAG